MTPEKIVRVVANYRNVLTAAGVKQKCIKKNHTLASCTRLEIIAHALYLIDQFPRIDIERQFGKANRHLSAIQTCLSFAGYYSLDEIEQHNRP